MKTWYICSIILYLLICSTQAAAPAFLQAISSALGSMPFAGFPMSLGGLSGAKLAVGGKLLYYLGMFGGRSQPKPPKPAMSLQVNQFGSQPGGFSQNQFYSGGSNFMGGQQGMPGGNFMQQQKPANVQKPPPDPMVLMRALSEQGINPMQLMQALSSAGIDPLQMLQGLQGGNSMQGPAPDPMVLMQALSQQGISPLQLMQALTSAGIDPAQMLQIMGGGPGNRAGKPQSPASPPQNFMPPKMAGSQGGFAGGMAGSSGGFAGGMAGSSGGFAGGMAGSSGGFACGMAGSSGGFAGGMGGGQFSSQMGSTSFGGMPPFSQSGGAESQAFPPQSKPVPGGSSMPHDFSDSLPPSSEHNVRDESAPEGESEEDVESFFAFLQDMDDNKCISRLICDIGSDPDFLGDFTRNIDTIINSLEVPSGSGAQEYMRILELGRTVGGCAESFPECDEDAYEIVKSVAPSVGVPGLSAGENLL